MEETIKTTVRLLKAALDTLGTAAAKELHGAEMGEASVEVFWKYARPILEMSNALEKAGFLPGKPDGGA